MASWDMDMGYPCGSEQAGWGQTVVGSAYDWEGWQSAWSQGGAVLEAAWLGEEATRGPLGDTAGGARVGGLGGVITNF